MSRRVRTVFLGSGRFGVESLRRIEADANVHLAGVVTAPPRPAGRGGRLAATPIDDVATELAVPAILRVERLRAPEAIAQLLALEPELAVLADFGQLVPAPILELRHGALNLHPSLLPRHRGASPIQATILAGDVATGVTLIRMDEGLDTGPIVAQSRRALDGTETAPELEVLLERDAADLLGQQLGAWLDGLIEPRPQPAEGATMTRVLRREDGRLDPRRPALALERQVRAYQPWPGSFLDTPAGRLTVWRARPVSSGPARGAQVGALVRLPAGPADGERLGLVTDDAVLELLDVQLAGSRRMSAVELLRGRPWLAGGMPDEASSAPSGGER